MLETISPADGNEAPYTGGIDIPATGGIVTPVLVGEGGLTAGAKAPTAGPANSFIFSEDGNSGLFKTVGFHQLCCSGGIVLSHVNQSS